MKVAGDEITLQRVRGTSPLWVFRGGEPVAASVTDETLRRVPKSDRKATQAEIRQYMESL